MKNKLLINSFFTVLFSSLQLSVFGCQEPLSEGTDRFLIGDSVSIVYDGQGSALDSISAHLLANDMEALTGNKPKVSTDISGEEENLIIIGNLQSKLVREYIAPSSEESKELDGQWERFLLKKVSSNSGQHLIITGSDDRGTAYGVFEVSKQLGVSPWYWWADVPVQKKETLELENLPYMSPTPSVKYRGIFINDEDWGLQPWAEKTFEPSTGDIGPKTYAKIFELLLRLKANLVWPAMHPSTKAFFHYPGNAAMAKAFQIVVGTSHAEPMLRNNVDEWDKRKRGDFNYQTNKDQVYAYWEERVKESTDLDAIFTLGMRGIHDSGMEGVKSKEDAVRVLEGVINDQRGLLDRYMDKDVEQVPQAFTAYKEVLDIYDAGLQLPNDITIVWPDDNYGYIRRLSNAEESERKGGAGVYYHASYWGRPHDYLWLSTTHPSLIREEMMKAYEMDVKELWVLNVGDIKPLEYNIELFMDMAYQAEPFISSQQTQKHFTQWHQSVFGEKVGGKLSKVLWQYYDLAFERRPEFMGWSQTEPTRPIQQTTYSHFSWEDEGQKRLDAYEALEAKVMEIKSDIPQEQFASFYQLAYYPVRSAALMSKKFLYRDKALLYAKEHRVAAQAYKQKSHKAYKEIVEETEFFNSKLLNGKWNNMMHMAPRNLPVYQDPEIDLGQEKKVGPGEKVGISLEKSAASGSEEMLPTFNSWTKKKHFFDLFLCVEEDVNWEAIALEDWIILGQQKGSLQSKDGESQARVWVEVDWKKVEATEVENEGEIQVSAGDQNFTVKVLAENRPVPSHQTKFVEDDYLVVMHAEHYTEKSDHKERSWELVKGLGHSGAGMQAKPFRVHSDAAESPGQNRPYLTYDIYTYHNSERAALILTALPTHPLTHQDGVRIGVSVDDGPMEVLDFETKGRSEAWKQNVLSNKTSKAYSVGELQGGKHTVKIYLIDPGVILDYIYLDIGGLDHAVSLLPETKMKP